MAVTLRPRPVPFDGELGDRIRTSAIVLDAGGDGDPWEIELEWKPVCEFWVATLTAANGEVVVEDAPARNQESITDNLSGLRPAGDLAIVTPDGSEPGRQAFAEDGARLYYFPDGLDAVYADAAGEDVTSTLPST